jgi:hypothetical protein
LFLNEIQDLPSVTKVVPVELTELTVGQWVSENPFTNYDTLNQLIYKVNDILKSRGLSERIDDSLIDLRDAIAHGRVFAPNPNGPYYILKFSKPNDGQTQVTVAIDMNSDWLSRQIRRTSDELMKIVKICQSLGLKCFSKD